MPYSSEDVDMASRKKTARKAETTADVPQVTHRDDAPDEPYDPCTQMGGQLLAAEAYYYTNCQTAKDFGAWWVLNQRALAASKAEGEGEREAGFKDGMYSASVALDEVLRDARNDIENMALDPVADTAARMMVEYVSRLWYERKGAM